MNFLAHIFLSNEDVELMLGNFLADFIRNRDILKFTERIQQGIYLHRKIDAYTDNHLIVRQGTKRLQSKHRKYAPVILDILYDYLLANNWNKYSNKTLNQFTQETYRILSANIDIMPQSLARRLPEMIANDWLVQYGRDEGLRFTFNKMKQRVSQPQHFENAVESLHDNYSLFEKEFNLFFPDVIDFVEKTNLFIDAR